LGGPFRAHIADRTGDGFAEVVTGHGGTSDPDARGRASVYDGRTGDLLYDVDEPP
jgi:hypothetical protein